MALLQKYWQGVLLCLAIAIPAWLLGRQFAVVGGPVFSILLGMAVGLVFTRRERFAPGITFTSKKILQYAVILLGFGLNLGTIISVGSRSLPVIVSTITVSLVMAFLLHKLMGVPGRISALIGVGSSICGGSAIAAAAPVVGADDEEIAQSISVIFLFNVIAALVFPSLGGVLGLSNEGFALFAGTAVNDTSSVTAAASSWDSIHNTGSTVLDAATIVKLTRTLAIIPITLVLALWRARQEQSSGTKVSIKKIFPVFIIYFVGASLFTTLCNQLIGAGLFPTLLAEGIAGFFALMKQVSKFFIVMAMAAIGLNTNPVKLIRSGGKPIFMGLCCWVSIAAVSLAMQRVLGIW